MARNETPNLPAETEPVVSTGGGWLLVHGLPLVTPAILAIVYAGLIEWAHHAWGGRPVLTPLMAIVLLLIGAGCTVFGWLAAGRRLLLRVLTVVSGGAATLTLVVGLIVGMGVIWPGYVVASLVVWVLWTIWRGGKYARTLGHGEQASNPLMEAIRASKVQFSGAKVDERGVIRAKVRTTDGATLDDARALMPALAAAARAVPGGSALNGDPKAEGLGEIEIATRDNLAVPGGIRWPGPAEVGANPTVPFAVGEYQTGPCMVSLVGDFDSDPDAEDIGHLKIGGVTGSGKSSGARMILANLVMRRRLNIVGIDLAKELQTFGPVAHGLTWVINDASEARRFMKRMRLVVEGRTKHLAREGLMRWSLRSSLNLLLIWIEESDEFMAFESDYVFLLGKARSAGIMVASSLRRATYRSMPTDARADHTAGMAFGCDSAEDVEYILPVPALQALGKNLPTWGTTRRGYCYIAGLGIPAQRWARMLRIYNPHDEQLIEAANLGARYRDPMDPVTAGLFGELYEHRTFYTGPVWGPAAAPPNTAPHAAPAAPARPAPVPSTRPEAASTITANGAPAASRSSRYPDDDQEREMGIEETTTAEAQQALAWMRKDLAESRRKHLGEDAQPVDFDENVDPHAPIDGDIDPDLNEDDPAGEDGQSRPKLSTEAAQRVFDEKLDALYRSGQEAIFTQDLVAWTNEVGRERRFLYRQRDRWAELGCIADRGDAEGWDIIASPMEKTTVG
ncbi:FtsK/SpoIIIE domain-containing protein [Nonomuraea typhae]|uniref:FtsK/SpoIIIE domain-containing protein n=1 Tax=Nonomuraea typhae TaxID=2603600 RepID=UPI0012F85A82|nr:FtsK/SpoIIIE domain-containing protein [Nonomuraea typhae]